MEDGLLLCEGETVHVVLGRDMKRRAIPKRYAEILGAASHPQAHGHAHAPAHK